MLERRPGAVPRDLWAELEDERGFRVVALYDVSGAFNAPRGWIKAGQWRIEGETTTGVSRNFVFYATHPDEVAPLQEHLADFEPHMAARSELILNENAPLQAMATAVAEREAAAGD